MIAGHTLHGIRSLVSCGPELRSRYLSSKIPWLYEGRTMQVSLRGVLNFCTPLLSALAMSERPRQIHCSAVVLSHYRPEMLCSTTCGNAKVAELLMATSTNTVLSTAPFTPWLHTVWFRIGATRGSHSWGFRGFADRPSSQRLRDTHFHESLGLCREYVPHRQHRK